MTAGYPPADRDAPNPTTIHPRVSTERGKWFNPGGCEFRPAVRKMGEEIRTPSGRSGPVLPGEGRCGYWDLAGLRAGHRRSRCLRPGQVVPVPVTHDPYSRDKRRTRHEQDRRKSPVKSLPCHSLFLFRPAVSSDCSRQTASGVSFARPKRPEPRRRPLGGSR